MSRYQQQFITYYFEYMRKQLAANQQCDATPPFLQRELGECLYKCSITKIKNLFIRFRMNDGQTTIDFDKLEDVHGTSIRAYIALFLKYDAATAPQITGAATE